MKKLNKKQKNTIKKISLVVVLLCLSFPINATNTHRYFYDQTGQLIKSVDSKGIVIEYVYDEVGNRLQTKRTETSGLVIFNFSPALGASGDVITIDGQQFSVTPENNIVTINGTAVNVLSASETQLQIEIPIAASNGLIEVSVGTNKTQSEIPLIVIKRPVINAILPNVIVSNPTEILNVDTEVTGFNFNTATFTLLPEFSEPPVSINNSAIDNSGLSANISLMLQIDTVGSFTLVGENTEGKSNTFPSEKNTLTVLQGSADEDNDGLSNFDEILAGTEVNNPDSDGDGFMDGDEVVDGSDPNNSNQTPFNVLTSFLSHSVSVYNEAFVFRDKIDSTKYQFTGPAFSIQNKAVIFNTPDGTGKFTASRTISVQNKAFVFNSASEPGKNEFVSPSISVQNKSLIFQTADGTSNFSASQTISVQNTALVFKSAAAPSKNEFVGSSISVQNLAP